MKLKPCLAFLFLLFEFNYQLFPQIKPIPIGSWRSHFDYTKGKALAKVGSKVFVAAENGFFLFNIIENETTILNTSDGFYDLNICQLAYNESTKTLVIAYKSGAIDLVSMDEKNEIKEIKNLLSIKNSSTILDSKITNKITFSNNIAFLSTDFGIVQIDLQKKQIKEIDQNLGPDGNKSSILTISIIGDKIYAFSESYLLSSTVTNNLQNFNEWNFTKIPNELAGSLHQLIATKNEIFGLFSEKGLYSLKNDNFQKIINITNECYDIETDGNNIYISAKNALISFEIATSKTIYMVDPLIVFPKQIVIDNNKLWIADNQSGLISNITGRFQKYNPSNTPGLLAVRNDSVVKDQLGISYTKLSAGSGLQIINQTGKKKVFSVIPLNQSNSRQSSTVNSIAVDKNNTIYLATNGGIVGLNSDDRLLDADNLVGYIITPTINGERTLANELVLSIAVDGGNRKWVGTSSALYLFNDDLSKIIEKFTDVNSPLPSNYISFLNLEPENGELFIYTANGIVSYRTNATEGGDTQENNVLVFPNPVKPEFDGLVGIAGLVANAFVKITDIAGRLVYQTQANGGTATWNLSSQNGQRVESGIYFIFSGNEFGKENFVTKLAVIK